MMKIAVIAIIALVLAGCVSSPGSIPPTYVVDTIYDDMSCEQLLAEKSKLDAELADLSGKQDAARTRAAVYNLFLVVGSGAMVRDRSDEIGEVKGKLTAVEAALTTCQSRQNQQDKQTGT